jgi:O-antigen ligase
MKKIALYPLGNNIPDFLLLSIVYGWFLAASKDERDFFTKSPMNLVVILIVLGSIISLIRSYTYIAPQMGFANDPRLANWKNYMILPVLYFISINNIRSEKMVIWIIICISFALLGMDLNFHSTFRWLKAEHYVDAARISGPLTRLGANSLGIFFATYTFLLLGLSYYVENRKLKLLLLFVCVCNLYPIIFSYSRSAYLCVLAGILTLGILKDRRMLLLLVVTVLLYRSILPNSVVERIDMTFLNKEEVTANEEMTKSALDMGPVTVHTVGRKELWEFASDYFRTNPVLGIGFDAFRLEVRMIAHNRYLTILAEQGLIGLTIFIFFTITLLTQGYKLFKCSKSKLGQGVGLGFLTAVIVDLVGGITGDISTYYNLMAIYWLFMGIVAGYNVRDTSHSRNAPSDADKTAL